MPTSYLRLTRTLDNPSPDRRSRYNFADAPQWPEGTLFALHQQPPRRLGDDLPELPGERSLTRVGHHGRIGQLDPRFQLIVTACEPQAPTLTTILDESGLRADDLLQQLLADETVSIEQVQQAAQSILDADDD